MPHLCQAASSRPGTSRVVVIGDMEATRLACSLLRERSSVVTHLLEPTEKDVAEALERDVDALVVIVHSDVQALRYALLASHLHPGLRIVTTVFDRTVSAHLAKVVPNCVTTSPADVSCASIIGAALVDGALAIRDTARGPVLVSRGADAQTLTERPWRPEKARWRGWERLVPRWHGGSPGLLLSGLLGLATILLVDWLLTVVVLHVSPVEAFYAATRTVSTVGPGDADRHPAPSWYLIVAAAFMLAAIVFTGTFIAGLVDWLMSTRTIGVIGRLALPRRGHVVVAGLGQVGLRTCLTLQSLGVSAVAIERNPAAENLRLARNAGIPVIIGHAEDRATLARVRLGHATALVALGSDESDNVAIAITALATAPGARVILRAGEDPVIAETRSLFRIGRVVDVSALAAMVAMLHATDRPPSLSFCEEGAVHAIVEEGELASHRPSRCECATVGGKQPLSLDAGTQRRG